MAKVEMTPRGSDDTGHTFEVTVDEAGKTSRHMVHLSHGDYEEWGSEAASPTEVAQRCVELLVERVSQDDLLDEFDLREALQLYPEFEDEVRRRLV